MPRTVLGAGGVGYNEYNRALRLGDSHNRRDDD